MPPIKLILNTMNKYHLFAHMDRNKVRVGDKVTKYKTLIGTVGKGNTNNFAAHLHFSISEGLTVDELYNYINGWSIEKIKKYYKDPRNIDFDKMFGRSVDVGKKGYDWLQPISGISFHPGVDVNGHGGGDTDFGYEFTSSCNGVVIHETRTEESNGGWGNLIIIEEKDADETEEDCCQKLNEANQIIKTLEKKLKDIKNISNI